MLNKSLFSSNSFEWGTPIDFFNGIDNEFHFTLDAAASEGNAKCTSFYSVEDNSLIQSWNGIVWCNPPYGRIIKEFVKKGYGEAQKGSVVVMLIPSRTDTSYWHDYVMKAKEIRFIRGRLHFESTRKTGSAPFPSALVVFEKGDFISQVSSIENGR